MKRKTQTVRNGKAVPVGWIVLRFPKKKQLENGPERWHPVVENKAHRAVQGGNAEDDSLVGWYDHAGSPAGGRVRVITAVQKD